MNYSLLLVGLILSGCAFNSSEKLCTYIDGNCFHKLSSKSVNLKGTPSSPFIYKVLNNNFVVYVEPEKLLKTLKKWDSSRETLPLINMLSSTLPLKENTDILKFKINADTPIYSLDMALATLIEEGNASVFDLNYSGSGEDVVRIDVLRGDAKYRFFYAREYLLFSVVDEVYD